MKNKIFIFLVGIIIGAISILNILFNWDAQRSCNRNGIILFILMFVVIPFIAVKIMKIQKN